MALEQGLKPLQSLAGSLFSNLLGGLSGILPFAKGGVPGHVVPFAGGGVVSSPSYFPMGRNVGLMGEAGPEAILPLQRSADGRLGVAASGGGGAVNVVFNVTTPDASSFRKSEAQVTGMLARAVSRARRAGLQTALCRLRSTVKWSRTCPSFHDVRFPLAHLLRRDRRAGAAQRDRFADLGTREAQCALLAVAPPLRRRHRRAVAGRPARCARLLRSAARFAACLPLSRSVRHEVLPAGRSRLALRTRCWERATACGRDLR